MQEQLRRDNDVVAHHGGERFTVILPGIGTIEAQRVCEKLRAAIDGLQIAHEGYR
jgi:PleD family two-component response regulator